MTLGKRHNHSHLQVIQCLQLTQLACDWNVGGSWKIKPTQARGEHAVSTRKAPESPDPGPSCCEATVLRGPIHQHIEKPLV